MCLSDCEQLLTLDKKSCMETCNYCLVRFDYDGTEIDSCFRGCACDYIEDQNFQPSDSDLFAFNCAFPVEICNDDISSLLDSEEQAEQVCDTCIEGCNEQLFGPSTCGFFCVCNEITDDPDFTDAFSRFGCDDQVDVCLEDYAQIHFGIAFFYGGTFSDPPLPEDIEPVPAEVCEYEAQFAISQCATQDFEDVLSEEEFDILVNQLGFDDEDLVALCQTEEICQVYSPEEQPLTETAICNSCNNLSVQVDLCLDDSSGFVGEDECFIRCDCDINCKVAEVTAEEGDMFEGYDACFEACIAD